MFDKISKLHSSINEMACRQLKYPCFSEKSNNHGPRIFESYITEICFDIWGILKMATVKSAEPGDNSFSIIQIIRCRSKLLPLGC